MNIMYLFLNDHLLLIIIIISECNYNVDLLMYSRVILHVTFFQYFEVMCPVNVLAHKVP